MELMVPKQIMIAFMLSTLETAKISISVLPDVVSIIFIDKQNF
jgi:hypothetical protein